MKRQTRAAEGRARLARQEAAYDQLLEVSRFIRRVAILANPPKDDVEAAVEPDVERLLVEAAITAVRLARLAYFLTDDLEPIA